MGEKRRKKDTIKDNKEWGNRRVKLRGRNSPRTQKPTSMFGSISLRDDQTNKKTNGYTQKTANVFSKREIARVKLVSSKHL